MARSFPVRGNAGVWRKFHRGDVARPPSQAGHFQAAPFMAPELAPGSLKCGSTKQSNFLPRQGYLVALLRFFRVNVICSETDFDDAPISHLHAVYL